MKSFGKIRASFLRMVSEKKTNKHLRRWSWRSFQFFPVGDERSEFYEAHRIFWRTIFSVRLSASESKHCVEDSIPPNRKPPEITSSLWNSKYRLVSQFARSRSSNHSNHFHLLSIRNFFLLVHDGMFFFHVFWHFFRRYIMNHYEHCRLSCRKRE